MAQQSSPFRSSLLGGLGLDPSQDVVQTLSDVAVAVPFVGPFAEILQSTVEVCNDFKANKSSAAEFKERLLDVGTCLLVAVDKFRSRHDLVRKYTENLADYIAECHAYLEKFSKKGFLSAIMVGNKPQQKFQEFDKRLTELLNQMNTALGITQLAVTDKTYDVVCNIERWILENGGFAGVANQDAKLDELAKKLECSKQDLQEELGDHLQRIEKDVQHTKIDTHFDEIKAELDSVIARYSSASISSSQQSPSPGFPVIDMRILHIDKKHVLGEGGFSRVYAGTYHGESVAVKTIKRIKLDEKSVAELHRDVEMMHVLSKCPGIVRLFGANFDRNNGELCIMLEQADGSLDDLIYTDKLQVDLTLATKTSIALDVAHAMDALSRLDILFRDAKPLNVFIFFRGRERRIVAKLTGFGLAKSSTDMTSTLGYKLKGTIPYMAPELFQDSSSGRVPYSAKSDVYAFGILLNELLTETRPFAESESNVVDLINKIRSGTRPKLFTSSSADFAAGIAFALENIVRNCLAHDPHSRPQFSVIVQDLEKVAEAVLKIAKNGMSPTMNWQPPKTVGLDELSVDDVVILLNQLEMPEHFCVAVSENRINGRALSYLESLEDLADCGLTASKIQSRFLLHTLRKFKDRGIAPEFTLKIEEAREKKNMKSDNLEKESKGEENEAK